MSECTVSPVAGGFFAFGTFGEQPVVGSGRTEQAAREDFGRVLGVIRRSWERWLTLSEKQNEPEQ